MRCEYQYSRSALSLRLSFTKGAVSASSVGTAPSGLGSAVREASTTCAMPSFTQNGT